METTYRDCYNIQQAHSWSKAFDSYKTNRASGYEASEAKYLQEESSKSAQDFNSSMHRIFKNDLRLTAYIEQSRQLLSVASKQKRHDCGKSMLAEMQRAVDYVFIWSDQKIFTVEAVTNTQNNRLYARDAGDFPEKLSFSLTSYETS